MPAQWQKNGKTDKGAGFKRNAEMAQFADGLLAFHNGVSKGTANMISVMRKLGKPVHVVLYDDPDASPHKGFHQMTGRFQKNGT